MNSTPQNLDGSKAGKKKWLPRIFVVVTILFINFQVSRLWLNSKKAEDDAEMMKRRTALKQRPLEVVKSAEPEVLPTPTRTEPVVTKKADVVLSVVPPPAVVPTPAKVQPSKTLAVSKLVAPIVHSGRSRLYVYFIDGKEQIKVDLFYDVFNDRIIRFIADSLRCRGSVGKNLNSEIKLNIKWLKDREFAPNPTSDYIGYLFSNDVKTDEDQLLLTREQSEDVPKNFKIVGGVISVGALNHSRGSNEELVYNRSEVLFTYVENEDTNAQYELFKRALDRLKSGCER